MNITEDEIILTLKDLTKTSKVCQSPISDKFTKFEEHPKLEINSYTMEFEEKQNYKSRTEAFVCEFYKNHTEQVNHLQYHFWGENCWHCLK